MREVPAALTYTLVSNRFKPSRVHCVWERIKNIKNGANTIINKKSKRRNLDISSKRFDQAVQTTSSVILGKVLGSKRQKLGECMLRRIKEIRLLYSDLKNEETDLNISSKRFDSTFQKTKRRLMDKLLLHGATPCSCSCSESTLTQHTSIPRS